MRTRHAAFVVAAILYAMPVGAQEAPVAQESDRVHVVRRGDTLWDLARQYLSDPFLWPEIFRLNAAVVQDPARIYPAERLRIPGSRVETAPSAERELVFGQAPDAAGGGAGITIRAARAADLPVVTPGDFYRAGFFADEREVTPLGRLAERLDATVVPVDGQPLILVYDRIFVTLADPGSVRIGDRLHFFRPDRRIKPYGRLYQSTGIATVSALDGNVATAVVTQLYGVLSRDDLALPLARFPVAAGRVPAPRSGIEGKVIAFDVPHILQSTQEIAYLDVGTAAVTEGDEFVVYQPSIRERWGVRPEIPIARVQVVRASGRTAATRVTELEHPALRPGLPVRLVAKMP